MDRRELKRLKRELKNRERHAEERKERVRGRWKTITSVAVIVVIISTAGYGFSAYTGFVASQPGPVDSFARCLTEKGASMYGAYWCPNCQRQKLNFGNSFKYVNYIECADGDPDGKAQPALCQEKGVTGYPTWLVEDQRAVGVQSMEQLAELTGCAL